MSSAPDRPKRRHRLPAIAAEGDSAVRVVFGDTIDASTNRRVHSFCRAVRSAGIAGVLDCVGAYAVAAVYYTPERVEFETLARLLKGLCRDSTDQTAVRPLIEIPVVYGGAYGPDLESVASTCGLTCDDVARRHSAQVYDCYMVGFKPGFPYLGELSQELQLPRMTTPRVRVAAGSVGIAGSQTGVYPQESPGGWHIIGRTPLRLYDPNGEPPVLVSPGDHVRFARIGEDEFVRLGQAVA